MNTPRKKYLFLLLMFFVASVITYAQTTPPNPNPPPPGLPIDGGLALIGLIGLVYGISKKGQ
jgi:hypothetical protein